MGGKNAWAKPGLIVGTLLFTLFAFTVTLAAFVVNLAPVGLQGRSVSFLVAAMICLAAVILSVGGLFRTLLTATRELTASEARARHDALHDNLTGLPNRAQFLQTLRAALEQRRQQAEDDLVIVGLFDLDQFKLVNDTLGHHVGDELICRVARRLAEQLGPGDLLARLGGDEFAILRRARRGSAEARQIGAEIIRGCAARFSIFDHDLSVSASCGISWAPGNGDDAGELMRAADIALERAKSRGGGRWRAFLSEMDASVRWRHELENELRSAIECDQLYMVYQPIVVSGSRKIAGFEALLRWDNPARGEIGPGVFVPVAEQAGQMQALGSWVIRRVFEDTKDWVGQSVSINLSPLQIMSRPFIQELRDLVQDVGVDPGRYTFEVTEGILLDRSEHVLAVLAEMRAMGFSVVLDDFGIGFSSLSYLRSFQFDGIKIDRSFVQNIENDLGGHAILRAIAALGRSLRMKIVAEGVETNLQHDLVVAAGCELVQGYHYWRALSSVQARALMGLDGSDGVLRKAG